MKKPAPRHISLLDKIRRRFSSLGQRRKPNMRVYSNLPNRRDLKARRKAEYLATLPKNPVKRFFYRLHPRRVAKYWFSRQGAIMALKLLGIAFILLLIFIAAIFAYFRKDLDRINPAELSKRVHSTTTKYYDRTGKVLLWEDKSSDNRTVVKSEEISENMKEATVALEDKDFYKHGGFSPSGIIRAGFSHLRGGAGGGSTITQQLIKNVLLTDEYTITRKIKEVILSIEVERLYNKDQILTMYLNEVSYGGNRNGVEAAAKEYFGKSAKDLTVDEAALLASIPQKPVDYDPWAQELDVSGLTNRQHVTIDKMTEQGYVTKEEADAAKKVNTLDKVLPPTSNTENMIAPHFVLEVQRQLENELGNKFVTTGGLKVITTLDVRLQQIADQSMKDGIQYVEKQGGDNAALVAVANDTGQILAYEGSRDFNYPGYGSYNAARALLQPGSSVKPFDYAALFKDRADKDYTPGSVLTDQPIDINGYSPKNFDKRYRGNITIRQALAESRNIPAVKAAYIAGMDNVVNLAHEMGDTSFCTTDSGGYCGLSAAIGGYSLRLDEHTNAYASLARGGVYKPLAYVLKVESATGETIKEWKDEQGKQVLDPQIPYMLSDILSDFNARAPTFGGKNYRNISGQVGFNPDGVKIAAKTGTTDDAKDGWMMGYSTKLSLGVWAGRSDGTTMVINGKPSVTHLQTGPMFEQFMSQAHKEVMKDYGWKSGDWFTAPSGIKKASSDGHFDLAPSWYQQNNSQGTKITMDKVSKRKATDCTPSRAREEITVNRIQDPISKKTTTTGVPDGYNIDENDNVHDCGDAKPAVSVNADTQSGKITATVSKGKFGLQSLEIKVGGQTVKTQSISNSGTFEISHDFTTAGQVQVSATVIDDGLYDASDNKTFNVVAKKDKDRKQSFNPFTVSTWELAGSYMNILQGKLLW